MEDIQMVSKKAMFLTLKNENIEAYLSLATPDKGEGKYTLLEVLEFLKTKGVVFGIDEVAISNLIECEIYNTPSLVAKGILKQDGEDGYFEFKFDHNVDNRPRILIDGSVDYRTLNRFSQVNEGEELIRYYPAIEGVRGCDVKGKVTIPYRGKDRRPIKGKGFIVSEDRTIYTAALSGKAEFKADRLVVTDVFEVMENVDYSTGNIEFEGDILIHGNVTIGMSVKSSGNITVEGHVEAAEIIAGKDIILQNGIQGGGRGRVEAKGNISGKFFEQTIINAGGNVNANSIMNCDVNCGGELIVSGKLGILVGGTITVLKKVSATIIGNMSETKTEIEVGLPESMFSVVNVLEKEILRNNSLLEKIEAATQALLKAEKTMEPSILQQKKLEIMRTKIQINKEISETTQKRTELIKKLEDIPDSKIVVLKRIYPGTKVTINGVSTIVNDVMVDVTIKRKGPDVCIFANE